MIALYMFKLWVTMFILPQPYETPESNWRAGKACRLAENAIQKNTK